MSLFNNKIKSETIAKKISITSPGSFKESIYQLKKGGLSLHEYKALVQAQNRAKAQLNRKNLSEHERLQFSEIVNTKIPNWREN